MLKRFKDGILNVTNQLANRRNQLSNNRIVQERIDYEEVRAIMATGLGSKILRIKSGYSLNGTIEFKSTEQEEYYREHLERHVRKAAGHMLAFGRGVIVIIESDKAPSEPLSPNIDLGENAHLAVLDGETIVAGNPVLDLRSPRYMKPQTYTARGVVFHPSRIIDFTYVEPAEQDRPMYSYGGISEFQLIRSQLVNDGIVERASATIVEKNSSFFYKVAGFKDSLSDDRDDEVISFYRATEDLRSIHGAGIIDAEDDVISVSQALTNLADVDQITLRRLAMVTGIALPILVGESVKGLNSSGDTEEQSTQDTIENLQFEYLERPIAELFKLFRLDWIGFKDNQGGTPLERLEYESKAIEGAKMLFEMGENHRTYLQDKDIIKQDDLLGLFSET